MRYLVTGASGFLGRHLTAALRGLGADVVGLCRSEEPELADLGARLVLGDVRDASAVERAADKCDGIFHAAGFVSHDPARAGDLWQVHVGGTRVVLEAARRRQVGRVVLVSTSGTVAVSARAEICNEDAPAPVGLIGRWPYYRAKLFAEQLALEARCAELEVVCTNPSLLLGPGDRRGSSTEIVRLFVERRLPVIPTGGLSFVDVRDAAAAIVRAMQTGRPGVRYLLGGCNLTMRELFGRLARLSGVAAPRLPLPLSPGLARAGAELVARAVARRGYELAVSPVALEMAQHFWYCDSTRAEVELGFAPRDPNETLRDTLAFLEARDLTSQTDAAPPRPSHTRSRSPAPASPETPRA